MGEIRGGQPEANTSPKDVKRHSLMAPEDRAVDPNPYEHRAELATSSSPELGVLPTPISECPDTVRSVRVKILDGIVSYLERKKPSWQKGRILHLSTQLEESMFSSEVSLAAFGDLGTLETRIDEHCFLLANRKQAEHPSIPTVQGVSLPRHGPGAKAVKYGPATPSPPTNIPHDRPGQSNEAGPSREATLSQMNGYIAQSFDPGGCTAALSQVVIVPEPESAPSEGGQSSEQAASPWTQGERHPLCPLTAGVDLRDVPSPRCERETSTLEDGTGHPVQNATGETPFYKVENDHAIRDTRSRDGDVGAKNTAARALTAEEGVLSEGGEVAVAGSEEVDSRTTSSTTSESWGSCTDSKSRLRHSATCAGIVNEQNEREAKQHALRLFQCRVFLLRHASSCSEANGGCQLSPLCESVRQLLQHIQSCHDRSALDCRFPHCSSSKAVLHHEHTCSDSTCHLCGSVRELSQKCFWASARHAHKRRLQESQEQRRKKRLQEGKLVPPPRKQQVDRKSAKELCVGLDEAGNYLGDISLGFFLRQDKAVKARKLAEGKPELPDGTPGALPRKMVTSALMDGVADANSAVEPPSSKPQEQTHQRRGSFASIGATGGKAPPAATSANGSLVSEERHSIAVHATGAYSSGRVRSTHAPLVAGVGSKLSSSTPCVRASHHRGIDGEELLTATSPSGAVRSSIIPRGRSTAIVPPSGASLGHLRTSSKILLDEIADSLKDTSRQSSLAKIQSVQAFLDQHGELRESPSFGDVCALVDEWTSLEEGLEEGPGEDEQLVLLSPFSF